MSGYLLPVSVNFTNDFKICLNWPRSRGAKFEKMMEI